MITGIEGSKMTDRTYAPPVPSTPFNVARQLLEKCDTATDALRLGERLSQSYAWREEVALYKLAAEKFPEHAETLKSRLEHPLMQRRRATFAEMERSGLLRRPANEELLALGTEV